MGELNFGILGPLAVSCRGQVCRAGRPKSRQLLATLLLHPNSFVSAELIADVLWGETRPRSAAANIRTYVHDIRDACIAESGVSPICTHAGGYSIEVEPNDLDAERFQLLAAEVRRHLGDGDDAAALPLAEQAHLLWRGHPLDDLPMAPAWQVALDRLEQERRELLDTLVELWMRSGSYQRACALLRQRIEEEPYSEPLWCHYITGLAASGRRTEARQAAAEIRSTLADELGTEPGDALCALEEQVTGSGAFDLAVEPPAAPPVEAAGHQRPVPCQLPLDVADFTGRAGELRHLLDLFTGGGGDRPLVALLSGPPGVGKTSLAVHLGHLLRDSFPDGQLFLDMRATSHPREASAAIGELLYSLGVFAEAIPADRDRRAAMLRSELAGRRVLVVLDDVASTEQVQPLLPGTGSSALLATSRLRLSDLPGVTRFTLGELDEEESASLLAGVAGADRPPLQSAETQAILRACGRLPLAIRVAGSRLAQRSDLPADNLAARLHDERRRLDELRVGDLEVRASADLSYRMLDVAEARLYHVLGLLGVSELPAWLLNESGVGDDPERVVDALVETNLVHVVGTDAAGYARYRLHDLLRCHALERALAEAPTQARADLAAVLTLLQARSALLAGRLPFLFLGVTVEPAADVAAPWGDVAAVEWFDAHRHVLTPLVKAAAEHSADQLAWQLAVSWAPYLDLRAHYQDWHDSHTVALECARRAGSARGEAILLRNLGQLAVYHDDYGQAERDLAAAYQLFDDLGHHEGSGVAAIGLGTCRRIVGADDEALRWFHLGLDHSLLAEDRGGEAVARSAIGGLQLRLREPETAAQWLTAAFELCRRSGDRHREALVRRRIAKLRDRQGDHEAAVRELWEALDLLAGIGDERCAARVRRSLGTRLAERGDPAAARRMLLMALDVSRRLGDARGEAVAAGRLGRLYEELGQRDSARQCHRRAQRAWRQVGTGSGAPTASLPSLAGR